MTNKRIVWERSDGGISVTIPAPKGRRPGESEADWVERVAARTLAANPSLNGATRLPDITASELPQSRYFRNCWRDDGLGRVHVDMPLARLQRMGEIRAERDERLGVLDVPWMRAIGQKDQAAADATEVLRQQLRELPARLATQGLLESLSTPKELAEFEPDWPLQKFT